jgi:endonuclease G
MKLANTILTLTFNRNYFSTDCIYSVAANPATFLMSSMMPQTRQNNQQTYANLESCVRSLFDAGNDLSIYL